MWAIIGLFNGATREFHTVLKILDTFTCIIWCSTICSNKAFVKINLKNSPMTSDFFIYLGLNRGRLASKNTGVGIWLHLAIKEPYETPKLAVRLGWSGCSNIHFCWAYFSEAGLLLSLHLPFLPILDFCSPTASVLPTEQAYQIKHGLSRCKRILIIACSWA